MIDTAISLSTRGHFRILKSGHFNFLLTKERDRLFRLIEELVKWENTTNEEVLEQARMEIQKSWRWTCADNADHPRAAELFDPDQLPAFHDPFAGGGALPLEAQRLGLEAYASDLNPVAVLINKAMIEIPPRFAGRPPVNLEARSDGSSNMTSLLQQEWKGTQGLAEDVRYYGKWMRDEAERRIGHLYPQVEITEAMVQERLDLKPYLGRKLTVIAWIWARTVRSPNPAFNDVEVPLASTFMLMTKRGKEAFIKPIIEGRGYRFAVNIGAPESLEKSKTGTKISESNFRCILSNSPISGDYIKAEGIAGRMGVRLMAIVTKGDRGRIFLSPMTEHVKITTLAKPTWCPENELVGKCRDQLPLYGMNTFAELYTHRQLVAMTTFSDLVSETIDRIKNDAATIGFTNDNQPLCDGGVGANAYAEAVGVYLAFAVDKMSDRHSTLGRWDPTPTASGVINTFSRQAIAMTWGLCRRQSIQQIIR